MYLHKKEKEMLIIGLTGGFGCGKSTVRKLLDRFDDVGVYDCDDTAKRILGSAGFRTVAETILGSDCFPGGFMNPKLIAEKFFREPKLKTKLEAALFPLVRQDINVSSDQAMLMGCRLFVIETAILFESGLNKTCDVTVCVVCPDDIRRERLKTNRGYTDDEITERLKHQMPDDERVAKTDTSISTACTLDEMNPRIQELHNHLIILYDIAERNGLS